MQNSGGKMVFSGGVPWNPPWPPTGVKYLGHLSVKSSTWLSGIQMELPNSKPIDFVSNFHVIHALGLGRI